MSEAKSVIISGGVGIIAGMLGMMAIKSFFGSDNDSKVFTSVAKDVLVDKQNTASNIEMLGSSLKEIGAVQGRISIFDRSEYEQASRIFSFAEEGKKIAMAPVDSFKVVGDTLFLRDFSPETVKAAINYKAPKNEMK